MTPADEMARINRGELPPAPFRVDLDVLQGAADAPPHTWTDATDSPGRLIGTSYEPAATLQEGGATLVIQLDGILDEALLDRPTVKLPKLD